MLPRLRLLTFPMIALGLGYLVFGPATKIQFTAGGIAGGFLALYMWVRDEPPEHVKRHRDGAEGERATAKALKPLTDAGWHVIHDIDTGRGNRDHVLIGPAGLFLIDSKKLGGRITIEGDTVQVERLDDERDSYSLPKLAGSLRGEAARLSREILAGVGVQAWVTAVVVFWSPFPAGMVEGSNIVFVHGDELIQWLRSKPDRMSAPIVSRIVTHLA